MDLWLDTVDLGMIQEAHELGVLGGITTNPSLVAASSLSLENLLSELVNATQCPIAVQVTASEAFDMIEQGKDLNDYSGRIIVKIPVTRAGLRAISRLSHAGIPTMATAVVTPHQALLALKAGATYAAPYLSKCPHGALATFSQIFENGPTKPVIASIRTIDQVITCAAHNFSVTVKKELFEEMLQTPQATQEALSTFASDWNQAQPSQLLTVS